MRAFAGPRRGPVRVFVKRGRGLRLLAAAAGLLAFAGCASSMRSEAPAGRDETRDAEELSLRLEESEQELDERLAAARCGDACEAGARICELAARICEIGERHRGDAALHARCEDGAVRCERARERLSNACQCTAGGEPAAPVDAEPVDEAEP